MDNDNILRIAMQQQAIDYNCSPEDFCSSENKVVISMKTVTGTMIPSVYLRLSAKVNMKHIHPVIQ